MTRSGSALTRSESELPLNDDAAECDAGSPMAWGSVLAYRSPAEVAGTWVDPTVLQTRAT